MDIHYFWMIWALKAVHYVLIILLLQGSCCFCEPFTSVPFPLTVPLTLTIALSFFSIQCLARRQKLSMQILRRNSLTIGLLWTKNRRSAQYLNSTVYSRVKVQGTYSTCYSEESAVQANQQQEVFKICSYAVFHQENKELFCTCSSSLIQLQK